MYVVLGGRKTAVVSLTIFSKKIKLIVFYVYAITKIKFKKKIVALVIKYSASKNIVKLRMQMQLK